jgi:hypothetical protein
MKPTQELTVAEAYRTLTIKGKRTKQGTTLRTLT